MVGWANNTPYGAISIMQFPSVAAWLDRIAARSAVRSGISIPSPPKNSVANMAKRLQEGEPGLKETEDLVKRQVEDAKAAYNYVYRSP
jgi:glutathione S-transferase